MPIASHSYDAATQAYAVQFKAGGPVYRYADVPADAAADLTNAQETDIGKLVQSTLVRGSYEFTKMPPPDEAENGGAP